MTDLATYLFLSIWFGLQTKALEWVIKKWR